MHLIDRERPPRATACGTSVAQHLSQTSGRRLSGRRGFAGPSDSGEEPICRY
jgi:hypothetical protein